MSEHKIPIPAMLYNAAVRGHVTNSQQIIDENLNKEQSQINAEVKQTLGQGGSVDSRIADAVNTEKTRAEAAEQLLQEQYDALTQSDIIVGALPESGTKNLIYRVPGTNSYYDYMWNGTQFVKMAEYNNAIDDKPIEGSENLVKSGGIFKSLNDLNEDINEVRNDIYTKELCNKTLTATVDSKQYSGNKLIPVVNYAQRIRITITGMDITQVSCQTLSYTNSTLINGDFSNGVVTDIPANMYYWYISYNSPQENTEYNVLIERLTLQEIVKIHDTKIKHINDYLFESMESIKYSIAREGFIGPDLKIASTALGYILEPISVKKGDIISFSAGTKYGPHTMLGFKKNNSTATGEVMDKDSAVLSWVDNCYLTIVGMAPFDGYAFIYYHKNYPIKDIYKYGNHSAVANIIELINYRNNINKAFDSFESYIQAEAENKKFISLHSGIDTRSISNGTSKYDEIRATSSDANMSIEACSLIYNLRKIADEGKHVFSMDGYYINSATSNYIDNGDGTYSPVPVEDIDETDVHQIGHHRTAITDSHCAMAHYELSYILNSWVADGSSTDANATKKKIATYISIIRYMWEIYGCVPSFSWHLCNPYIPCNPPSGVNISNGADYAYGDEGYPSNHRYVINEILNNTGETCGYGRVTGVDGQSYTNPREWFEAMCELVGDFIKNLKDSHGNNIPVILRLWHEFDDTWTWWGANMVTAKDYISFYQLTVNLIKQYSNTHNILFGFCPDRLKLDTVYKTHYPGDEYVDIVGFDDYSIGRTNEDIGKRVKFICNFADTHNKISAIFETGNGWEGNRELNVFNDFLYPAVSNGDRLSIIQMWSTVYVTGNHFGDGAENDAIRAADLRKFVNRHDMLTFDFETGTNPINWIKIIEK